MSLRINITEPVEHSTVDEIDEEVTKNGVSEPIIIDLRENFKKKEQENEQIISDLSKQNKMEKMHNKKLQEKISLLEARYQEEKIINEGMRENYKHLQLEITKKNKEIKDINEQLRDIMVHLDSKEQLKKLDMKDDELAKAHLNLVAADKNRQRRK
ncbi:hypothetical protein I4U23_024239 [Adineta vaga]|nr:hypothetical protein I4U23_024239 [Adineta vaga]